MSDTFNPMVCSLPGSADHGIFQARILKPVAISYRRGSSRSRDGTRVSYVSCIGWQILYHSEHKSRKPRSDNMEK